jgi:hypothetical protein
MEDQQRVCRICQEPAPVENCLEVQGKYFYHAEHFNCKACKGSLVGVPCFEHEGEFLCEFDYVTLFNPPACGGCKEVIKSAYLRVGNQCFHDNCFVCGICKSPFTKDENQKFQYFPDEDKLVCTSCFYNPKCFACNQVFTDKFMRILGKKYHQQCFACAKCKNNFQNEQYFKADGEPLCESCYKLRAHSCEKCQQPILDKIYFVQGKHWHFSCLSCKGCSKSFDSQGFLLINLDPYHKGCFIADCIVCQQKCEDEYLLVEGTKTVHKDCFGEYQKTLPLQPQSMRYAQQV